MDSINSKPKHIKKSRLVLSLIFFVIIIFILNSKYVNIKPDMIMDFNPSSYNNNKYLGTNAFFVTPSFAFAGAIPFGKSMNLYYENLTIRNNEIFSLRDSFLNLLQIKKPAVGDVVYLTLNIKNTGNAFDSYVDYILTDENDYTLNDSIAVNDFSSYSICGKQRIQIGPSQERTVNIRVNTQNFMNNGNYKVYVVFYSVFSDSRYPNCGQVDSQKTFYTIIPFTLYQESSRLGIIPYIAILYTILYIFLSRIPQISRFAEDKSNLDKLKKFEKIFRIIFASYDFWIFVILMILIMAIFSVLL